MVTRVEHLGPYIGESSTTTGIGLARNHFNVISALYRLARQPSFLSRSELGEGMVLLSGGTSDLSIHNADVRAVRALADMTCPGPIFVSTELGEDTAVLGRPDSVRPINLQIVAHEEMVPLLFADDFADWEHETMP